MQSEVTNFAELFNIISLHERDAGLLVVIMMVNSLQVHQRMEPFRSTLDIVIIA